MNQPALFRGIYPTMRQSKSSQPLTGTQMRMAEECYIRAFASRCPHTPPCGSRQGCIRQIAQEQKENGFI